MLCFKVCNHVKILFIIYTTTIWINLKNNSANKYIELVCSLKYLSNYYVVSLSLVFLYYSTNRFITFFNSVDIRFFNHTVMCQRLFIYKVNIMSIQKEYDITSTWKFNECVHILFIGFYNHICILTNNIFF